jgi:hypothetical protein
MKHKHEQYNNRVNETLLLYCSCLCFIHWPCNCTVHVYVSFIDPAIVLFMFMLHSLTLPMYCSCLCFIHWPCHCTVHVYASFIDPVIVLFMFMLHSLTLLLYCSCLCFIHWQYNSRVNEWSINMNSTISGSMNET